MEKTYGALIAELGRAAAESFFLSSGARKPAAKKAPEKRAPEKPE